MKKKREAIRASLFVHLSILFTDIMQSEANVIYYYYIIMIIMIVIIIRLSTYRFYYRHCCGSH